ncbi:plasmid stabilization system protein ParE [Rhizobium sp. PP-F2F-G48]|uniref:type II toxin-antitoxin system RelE/ParE family toxin n=1 Tax=Rhizobium sp. PP-F2F-G48 TaxID=2135651 RepID=UPI00104A8BF0|nr:type II toxin-antitoxin system RelE/ParE family toxin [Rhizobium sp. PP-F2F-G48]TCM55832.1 plasmid stabilization system protein ParE [Rhizobium sp. PP-F2F-G48]
MSTRYRVRYHREAEQDLVEIYDLVANYAGKQAAQRILRDIESVVRALAAFPYRGSIRADFPDNFRVVPAAEKAVICITVHEDIKTVVVRHVGYAGSDWMVSVQGRLT